MALDSITPDELGRFLDQDETLRLEFKLCLNLTDQNKKERLNELFKDIIALINSAEKEDDYAYLIIGAGAERPRDYARVEPGQYNQRQFLQIVNERCWPRVLSIGYQEIELDDKLYGIIILPPSPHVHAVRSDLKTPKGNLKRDEVLLRRGDEVGIASPDDIRIMLERRKSWLRRTLTVKRLRDPQDQDLLRLCELQKKSFGEVDPIYKLKYWLSKEDSDSFSEMLLVLKLDDNVVGYLFAQHYITEGTIFVSYIGVDKEVKDAKSAGAICLLRKLITICDRKLPPWKRIIGEVEETGSELLLHVFNSNAQRLNAPAGSSVFILKLDYVEPAIRPGKRSSGLRHRILYFTKDTINLVRKESGFFLPSEEAKIILDIIILRVYGDGYKKDAEYQKYLRSELETYSSRISCGVDLLDVESDWP